MASHSSSLTTTNMPIDYSKWKKIEVSDDEDDTHPNIDTPSLFRWRHQARLERMAEKKQKKEELEKEKESSSSKMKDLEDKLSKATIDDKAKIQKEIDDLKSQEEKWMQKEKELEEQERLEPWNIDTIGHEAFSSSRINKITEKQPPKPVNEEEDSKRMSEFFEKYETEIQAFGRLTGGLKVSEEFLLQHPHIASDYTASFLTIECLNLAIDGENSKEKLYIMTQQTIIMQYLLELAKSLNAVATNTTIIRAFFTKFAKADEQYMKMYQDEVNAFRTRLLIRAKEKKENAIAEYESEQRQKRIDASPGGLDPQEVYESLPDEMRECFESQNIARLHEVAAAMDKEVFAYHFDRCIKSGLWVPGPQNEQSDHEDLTSTADEIDDAQDLADQASTE